MFPFSNDPNSKLTPELLTQVGLGLLGGRNVQEQATGAALGATAALASQKEKAALDLQKNQTYQTLMKTAPDLAQAVQLGAVAPKDAYMEFFKRQQDAQTANKPVWTVLPDGKYGWALPGSQSFNQIGTAIKPDVPEAAKVFNYGKEHPDFAEHQNKVDAVKNAPASVGEYLWARENQGFTGSLEDYQKNKISLKNQKGTEGNLKGDLETMKAYRGEDPIKTFQVTHAAFQKARSAAQLGTAAGDMSLIYAFMKMNDPTSVVREGEYANASNAGGVEDTIRNIYNRVKDGTTLTPQQREGFIQAAQKQYEDAAKNVEDVNKRYTPFASDYNVNTDRFMIQPEKFPDLKVGAPPISVTTQSGKTGTIEKLSD